MAKPLTYQKARKWAARMLKNRTWENCLGTPLWQELRGYESWKSLTDSELFQTRWRFHVIKEQLRNEIKNYGNRDDQLMLCAGLFAEGYYINQKQRTHESQDQADSIEKSIHTVSRFNHEWFVDRCFEIMEQNELRESPLQRTEGEAESSSQPGQPIVDNPMQKEPYINDEGKWCGETVELARFLWYHHTESFNTFKFKAELLRRACSKHGIDVDHFESFKRRFRETPSLKGKKSCFPPELDQRAHLLFGYLSE